MELGVHAYVLSFEGAEYISSQVLSFRDVTAPIDFIYQQILSRYSLHLRSPPDNNRNYIEDYKHLQKWRHKMWECGIVTRYQHRVDERKYSRSQQETGGYLHINFMYSTC
jgi:hypothetical protein